MPPQTVTINLQFNIGGESVKAQIPVPAGPTHARIMLPVFQALGEIAVERAVKMVEAKGEKVSCTKGCGACCRQLVPITPIEAHHLRDHVEAMPEPRRSEIRARFAEARRRLEEAGMLATLLAPEQIGGGHRQLGLDYFYQKIACPFLEEESCSIYSERPIACREYLVTSPASACAQPTAETVRQVPVPAKVSVAVADLGVKKESRYVRWVPLIVAEEWAAAHPEAETPRPGAEILRELFERLAGKGTKHPGFAQKRRSGVLDGE